MSSGEFGDCCTVGVIGAGFDSRFVGVKTVVVKIVARTDSVTTLDGIGMVAFIILEFKMSSASVNTNYLFLMLYIF